MDELLITSDMESLLGLLLNNNDVFAVKYSNAFILYTCLIESRIIAIFKCSFHLSIKKSI